MDDPTWLRCLQVCRRRLGRGDWDPCLSDSWCAFTTFSSIQNGIHYWSCGFPDEEELLESRTADGGLWRQSFEYRDLAHLVIPKQFLWEGFVDGEFQVGYKGQDLVGLSGEFDQLGISHRMTDIVLEIKLY